MFGLSTSQSVSSIALLFLVVFYFAANTSAIQNAAIFFFSIALIMLIVGTDNKM